MQRQLHMCILDEKGRKREINPLIIALRDPESVIAFRESIRFYFVHLESPKQSP